MCATITTVFRLVSVPNQLKDFPFSFSQCLILDTYLTFVIQLKLNARQFKLLQVSIYSKIRFKLSDKKFGIDVLDRFRTMEEATTRSIIHFVPRRIVHTLRQFTSLF